MSRFHDMMVKEADKALAVLDSEARVIGDMDYELAVLPFWKSYQRAYTEYRAVATWVTANVGKLPLHKMKIWLERNDYMWLSSERAYGEYIHARNTYFHGA